MKTDAEKVKILRQALRAAIDHLDYTGYGDNWERECAMEAKLPETLEAAMKDTA
jgi:hypothetical protein